MPAVVIAEGHTDVMSNKKQSTYGAWVRPTVSWSLQCEWDGISRQIGFEAFQTRFDDLGNAKIFEKVGYFFVLCMVTPFIVCFISSAIVLRAPGPQAFQLVIAFTSAAFVAFYFISRIVFFTFFLNLLTMTTDERDKVDANREDMKRVEILRACGDTYSRVDEVRIKNDMHKAQKALDEIYWVVWVMLAFIFLELAFIIPNVRYRESLQMARRYARQNDD